MNKLYSILTYKVGVSSGAFSKTRENVLLDDRSKLLTDYIMPDGMANSDCMRLACLLCWGVKYTPFGVEIYKIDSNNTYSDVTSFVESRGSMEDKVYDLIRPEGGESRVISCLDDDIKKRLYVPTWLELAGGISLQTLRNTYA